MIYFAVCQVSSVKLMRLFEYNGSMCHSLPHRTDDREGDKSVNHLELPRRRKRDLMVLTLQIYLEISSQLKPSGFVCGLVGELIDNY